MVGDVARGNNISALSEKLEILEKKGIKIDRL